MRLNKGFFRERTAVPETDLRRYLRLLPLTKLSCVGGECYGSYVGALGLATSPIFATRGRSGRPREARSHTNPSVRVLAVCLAKYPLRGSHHQLRTPCCRPPDCRRLTSTRLRYHLGMYGRARPQEGKPATPKCDHPADPFRRGDARGCRRITRHRRSGGRNWISLAMVAFRSRPSLPLRFAGLFAMLRRQSSTVCFSRPAAKHVGIVHNFARRFVIACDRLRLRPARIGERFRGQSLERRAVLIVHADTASLS